DPRPDTRTVRRPRNAPASGTPPAGDAPGLEVSLSQLLEHRLFELGFGQQLLQPGVLALEFLETLRLVGLHAAVLRAPPRPARLRDLEMPQHLGQLGALIEHPIALAQLPDDLLGCVPLAFHRDVLLPTMLGVGLSRHVDHYPGSRQRAE